MAYKLSVIIPVYNAEKTLERAFLSVKNQTIGFENIELLICDDFSTDKSYKLIKEWAEKYPNVKAFKTNENSGAAGTPRNVCLDNATAPFVMFLDSDDTYEQNACKALFEAICRYNADAVTGYSVAVSDKGFAVDSKGLFSNERTIEDIIIDEPSSPKLVSQFYSHGQWSKIYKREIIERYRIRFPEGVICEDVVFGIIYVLLSERVIFINQNIVNYCVRSDSISHDKKAEYYKEIPIAICEGYETAKKYGVDKGYCEVIEEFQLIDSNFSEIINSKFSYEDIYEILTQWKPLLLWCCNGYYESKTGYPLITALDFLNDELEKKTLINFKVVQKIKEYQDRQVEDLKAQRRKELDDIYGSTTWKVASLLQSIKFWSK